MRQIKFRIWNKGLERFETQYTDLMINQDSELKEFVAFGYEPYLSDIYNENLIIEQFTGLQDKNGVDIYFGDVVSKYHDDKDEEKDIRIVEQIKGHTEIGCFNYYEDSKDFTIIGNIHENKNLLE